MHDTEARTNQQLCDDETRLIRSSWDTVSSSGPRSAADLEKLSSNSAELRVVLQRMGELECQPMAESGFPGC